MTYRKIPRYDLYDVEGRPKVDAVLALAGTNPMLIAMGVIQGVSQVNKFGAAPNITVNTEADVWDGANTYTFPTTADITHVHQVADQAAMRGQTIEVQGLDINWELVIQDVELDASDTSTRVALTTPLLRVFRMKVMANVVADSNIQAVSNTSPEVVYAIIRTPKNQTLMAIYTVPAGKTAYVAQWYADNTPTATKDPDSTKFDLRMADRANGYEFQVKSQRGIPRNSGGFDHDFKPYLKVTEKTDIKISALVAGSVGEDANPHCGFDLILIDN